MKFSFKNHGPVLAACDAELLGKTIQDGDVTIAISEQFYGGGHADEAKMKELLKSHANINLIGKRIIALARKNKFVKVTKTINKVPYAFIFKI